MSEISRPSGKLDLTILQAAHSEWLRHNFPNEVPYEALLGVVEEVGELAHAWLKDHQGVRAVELSALERDAVGDIFVYLMGYCTLRGLSIEDCIAETWDEVKQRDWVKFPKNGVDE